MSRAYKGFGLAVLLSVSAHAGAALTVTDWRTPGDGLVIRDPATGYEWLKPSVTVGQSFNGMLAQIEAGAAYSGWMIATQQQLTRLLNGSAAIATTFPGTRDLEAEVDDPGLIALLSSVGPTFTLTLDYGLPKGPFVMTGVGGRYDIGSSRYTGLIVLSRATWASDGSFYFNRYLQYACCDERDWSGLDNGVWLTRVAPIPGPPAWVLMSAGLAAVGGIAARRRRLAGGIAAHRDSQEVWRSLSDD
jgi:hypothetical protein